MPEPTDARGTRIEVGRRVVVNVSGDLGLAVVVAIKPGTKYGWRNWVTHAKLLHRVAGQPAGHISKIANSRSVLVLLEDDYA